jgi:Nif-specific regulatory protein
VLQEGEFERVGGSRTIKVDVRLVAATNRNLEAAVLSGRFRSDLYYRISVVPIFLPPLRDRREDIALLAREFLRGFNREHDVSFTFSPGAVEVLRGCDFPGNVRELESCVRRTAALAKNSTLGAEDFACSQGDCLSQVMGKSMSKMHPQDTGYVDIDLPIVPPMADRVRTVQKIVEPPAFPDGNSLEIPVHRQSANGEEAASFERLRLVEAMERAGWVQARAARLLGLTSRQMGYALRKFNVEIKRF